MALCNLTSALERGNDLTAANPCESLSPGREDRKHVFGRRIIGGQVTHFEAKTGEVESYLADAGCGGFVLHYCTTRQTTRVQTNIQTVTLLMMRFAKRRKGAFLIRGGHLRSALSDRLTGRFSSQFFRSIPSASEAA